MARQDPDVRILIRHFATRHRNHRLLSLSVRNIAKFFLCNLGPESGMADGKVVPACFLYSPIWFRSSGRYRFNLPYRSSESRSLSALPARYRQVQRR